MVIAPTMGTVIDSSYAAFADDLAAWCTQRDDAALRRAASSHHSRLPLEAVAAASALAKDDRTFIEAGLEIGRHLPDALHDVLLAFIRTIETLAAGDIATCFPPLERTRRKHDAALSLAPPNRRETPGSVPTRVTRFSASALNAYAECPRKWFYRYACGAVEDDGSSAATYGTAFHAALEDFHGDVLHPSDVPASALRDGLARQIDRAFERYSTKFDSELERELQRRRAHRTAKRYIAWLIDHARRAPFATVGRELPVRLEIDGFPFVGYIDRLDRDDNSGEVAVFDYKTGTIAESAVEYRERIRRGQEFQLPFYYWACTISGERVRSIALLPLKSHLVEVRPIELLVTESSSARTNGKEAPRGEITVSDLEAARAGMIDLCRELTSGEIREFAVTDDPEACTYCAYATACRMRPIPPEDRFGR